jgi:hypothetical protein
MNHRSRLPRSAVRIQQLTPGRRGKLQLTTYWPDRTCYHLYPENRDTILEMWQGTSEDRALALAWLGAQYNCELIDDKIYPGKGLFEFLNSGMTISYHPTTTSITPLMEYCSYVFTGENQAGNERWKLYGNPPKKKVYQTGSMLTKFSLMPIIS